MTDLDMQIGKKYFEGLTDYKIAKALDITTSRVATWRKRFNLPRNPRVYNTTSRSHYAQVKTLYDKGYNDAEISEMSDVVVGRIDRWRRLQNLPKNTQKQFNESDIMELYKLGFSDNDIARIIKTYPKQISLWREANNLPVISRKQYHETYHETFEEADKVPVTELFDKQSLFYNSKFIRQFVSGEITNGGYSSTT